MTVRVDWKWGKLPPAGIGNFQRAEERRLMRKAVLEEIAGYLA
jgi:hypothetical protein